MKRIREAGDPFGPEPLHQVAGILAEGVLRLARRGQDASGIEQPFSETALKTASEDLEQSAETRLSASDGTRGLRLRDDGDNA